MTLATTGVLSFLQPFSIVTTRIHIVFGLTTAVLVAMHLAARTKYFRMQLAGFRSKKEAQAQQPRSGISAGSLAGIVVIWAALLVTAIANWQPASLLIDQGYESRHQAEIVRASPLTGLLKTDKFETIVARQPNENADLGLSLSIHYSDKLKHPPAIAIWTETTVGTMIETLYLEQSIAFSDNPIWNGKSTPRNQILPIWRHRHTMISGVDPEGEVDAFSAATPTHSFTLDDYLVTGGNEDVVLCIEINLGGDANQHYSDLHIGQPSLLYTALFKVNNEQPYKILELTGHGGGAEKSGAIHYDLEEHTTAKRIIELALARIDRAKQ